MKTEYRLVFEQERIHLFNSSFAYRSEEEALEGLCHSPEAIGSRSEEAIRDVYAHLKGHYDSTTDPLQLLRIVLGNGGNLLLSKEDYQFQLCKSHFPVNYIGVRDGRTVQIGEFFTTSINDADFQFPRYCQWVDNQCGAIGTSRYYARLVLAEGFGIFAQSKNSRICLIALDKSGKFIQGLPNTLKFCLLD